MKVLAVGTVKRESGRSSMRLVRAHRYRQAPTLQGAGEAEGQDASNGGNGLFD